MSNINKCFVSGRLTRDPELRTTPSGTSVANVGLAVERYRKDDEPEVSFFDLTIWSGFAELVSNKARKGDTVTVEGRLQQQRWDDKDGGGKRSKVEIVVDQMEGDFLYRKADGSDTPERSEAQQSIQDGAGGQNVAAAAPVAADDDIPF